VAASAAAHQDLAAAVRRSFDEDDGNAVTGGEDGSGQSRGAGADDDDRGYLKNSATGTTRIGPRPSGPVPCAMTLRAPTPTAAIGSGWMCAAATRCRSADVTLVTLLTSVSNVSSGRS